MATPGDEIRAAKAELQKSVRAAIEKFVSDSGVALTRVRVDFADVTLMSYDRQETLPIDVVVEFNV